MSQALVPRRSLRRPVVLAATCRTQTGLRDNAHISDISPHGCRLMPRTLSMMIGQRILIRPQGLEGVSGVVRWIEGQQLGIEFDSPLYEPVVDHLSQLYSAGRTVNIASF